jgi:UDP:flavonoid glycosyltransferase YjiC (YdhE family)
MAKKHVAFILESVYGHIVPTLGIAAELIHRGHRVSYAVKRQFEHRILGSGAQAKVYQPLENKLKLFRAMKNEGVGFFNEADASLWKKLHQEETLDTLSKLESLYEPDRPDLIVYDFMNPAGKLLAGKLNTAAVEHSPTVISQNDPLSLGPHDENLVLVSIPRFFQRNADALDDRFQFIGFIQNDRKQFFAPWRPKDSGKKLILISATTGLLPQTEFLRKAIAAFGDSPWYLVLTIGDEINPDSLAPLPANCEINRSASNFEILETACLVIGQAGQGSALEALYRAVPQLLIPPSPIHDDCAIRIAELGLGTRLPESEATVENLKTAGISLLADQAMRNRLQEVAKTMRKSKGAAIAADLIGKHIVRRQF